MFAVLKTGGKQYKVQSGDTLRIEKLSATAGDTVQFNDILMIGGDSPILGSPLVDGAAVQAEVLEQAKADKVISFVKRRRKHGSQRTRGHRQKLTVIRVTDILTSGAATEGDAVAVGAISLGVVEKPVAEKKAPKPAAEVAPEAEQIETNAAPEASADVAAGETKE